MDIGTIVIQVITLIFALSFHEMAHAWAAWKLGDPTAKAEGRLTMNPIPHIDPKSMAPRDADQPARPRKRAERMSSKAALLASP